MLVRMEPSIHVLFLCTGNSCRSQMAEALLAHVSGGRFTVSSAGSKPAGYVHPLAVEALRRLKIPLHEARSKSWDEFVDQRIDVAITLCDAAVSEPCPAFPGEPLRAHWSLPDPTYHFGNDEDRVQFAVRVAERLRAKIEGLIALDWSAPRGEVERRLRYLGEI